MRYILTFLILLPVCCLNAQVKPLTGPDKPDLKFRSYNADNGMTQNTVNCIMQDSIGFIWLGTTGGLNRFDGRSFKSFMVSRLDTISIGNNMITCMIEYKKHHFLIGTENGLYWFDLETDIFTKFSKLTDRKNGISASISSLLLDNTGNIWIASMGEGLFLYTPHNDQLKLFKNNPSDPSSISSNNISAIYQDKNDIIWAGTSEGTLNRFSIPINGFVKYYHEFNPESQSANKVNCIYEDSKNRLWVGTQKNGLYLVQMGIGALKHYDFHLQKERKGINAIQVIHEYLDQNLLIGTEEGLIIFNPDKSTYIKYAYNPNNPNSLSDNIILSIHQDREGSYWIGTRYGGVNLLPRTLKKIEHYLPGDASDNVKGRVITEFQEDQNGNLWIGTEDEGLFYFNTHLKTFEHFPASKLPNSLSHHNVQTLLLNSEKLWIGFFSDGIDILDLQTGQFKNHQAQYGSSNTLPANHVADIFLDSSGIIWIGTDNGLCTHNQHDDGFKRIDAPVIKDAAIRDIFQDRNGHIWVGTNGSGIFKYDKRNDKWIQYIHIPGDPTSAFSNNINCIYQDNKGTLWFGSEDTRIFYYDYTIDAFATDSYFFDSLTSDAVLSILDDDMGNLWIGSYSGLFKYNPSVEKLLYLFQHSDGFQSSQFNYKSAFKASDGKLYFGGINGFNSFYPSDIEMNPTIPTTVITSIKLFNEDIDIHDESSPLSKSAMFTQSIVLNHTQSVIGIEFAGLSYILPEKNRYSYMIEGYDKDWVFLHNQNEITISNLEPGQYTLYVKTSNNDGVYNEQPTALSIKILPPFWKTTWAYAFYVLVIGLSLYLFAVYMNRAADRKNKARIIEFNLQKEKEIADLKIDFFTNIAHEIKTPLMLINGPIERLISKKEGSNESQEDYQLINKNVNRLFHLVNQLLNFRKIDKKKYKLNYAQINIVDFVHEVFTGFTPLAKQRDINFVFRSNVSFFESYLDPEVIIKALSNLLTNAFKYTNQKIEVVIYVRATSKNMHPDDQYFDISVIDDGIGIDKDKHAAIFNPFYQVHDKRKESFSFTGTGLGLSFAKSLVELHKGRLLIDSEPDKGARFTIQIPVIKKITIEGQGETWKDQNRDAIKKYILDDIPAELFGKEDTFREFVISSGNPDILIVEDNEELRLFLRRHFQNRFNITLAENGLKALDILKEHEFDLIITDILMPGMDGIEFCKQVKSDFETSHIPIIIFTGKTTLDTKIISTETGADAFVEKPFSLQYLSVLIQNILDSRNKLKIRFSQQPFFKTSDITSSHADKKFLDRIDEMILANIDNTEFSTEELAKAVNISRSSLHKKLKAISGLTPNDYIKIIRLKKAAEYLKCGNYRINEICDMVGFNTPSYFSKCFNDQFGVLPSEFTRVKV